VWEPIFHPNNGSVIAPVKLKDGWTLAQDDNVLWDSRFTQVWHQMASRQSDKIAAIAATSFGKWTIAVDGKPWGITFGDMVTDAVFSPDGSRVACIGTDKEKYTICDDGKAWDIKCDMVWKPVFSPDGSKVAAKIDKNGKRTIAVNGKLWNKMCDEVWEPVFSPDGSKILCRSVEDGKYYRRVIPVSEF